MTDASTPAVSRSSELLRDGSWLLLYVPLSLAFTWPLAAKFTTALAGERDSWQNLWNIVWLRRSLLAGHNPFVTHSLWHPDGATLIFQTFDLPDSTWAAALTGLIGMWATYNLVVLWTFIASGAAMFMLARGTGASRPAAFFAGCAYTFSTYHFAHALAHLHLLSMQWAPLYVLAFLHTMEDRDSLRRTWRWPVAGAIFLALASLSSWYYLLDLFIVSVALTIAWIVRERGRGLVAFVIRGAILCLVYLALIAPLGVAMLRARSAEKFEGAHPAAFYSADWESFVFANDAQWLGDAPFPEFKSHPILTRALNAFKEHRHHWTGNSGETAAYLGAVLVLIVLAGWVLRARRVSGYLLAVVFGITLALGPQLHIDGNPKWGEVLPYARLLHAFPLLEFMGMPVRLAWVAMFGLSAALAPSLDALVRKISWKAAAPLAILAVLEHSPHAFTMTHFDTPAPMLEWARDPTPFAVLDTCNDDERKEWHQTLHGHPIFGTHLSRTPEKLSSKLTNDNVVYPLMATEGIERREKMQADVLDFSFNDPVALGAQPNHFSFELSGVLHVPKAGAAEFRILCDDGAWIAIDNKRVVESAGPHAATEKKGGVNLTAGDHILTTHYDQVDGDAVYQAWWTPYGEKERLLGKQDVPGGFAGTVDFHRREVQLPKEAALNHLRQLNVRYIVQCEEDVGYIPETQFGLHPIYSADDVRIYRVPDKAETPAAKR